jgi:hypothetical protein
MYGNAGHVIPKHNRKRDPRDDDRYEEKVAVILPPCGCDTGDDTGDHLGDHSRNKGGKIGRLFHASSFLPDRSADAD